MKNLILILALGFSTSAMAIPVLSVNVERYWYAGTMNELVDSLQEELAEQLKDKCTSGRIGIVDLNVKFERGRLAGKGVLEAHSLVESGKPYIMFPGHPRAVLNAKFICD